MVLKKNGANIHWFQVLKCVAFFVLYYWKWNTFGFKTVSCKKNKQPEDVNIVFGNLTFCY